MTRTSRGALAVAGWLAAAGASAAGDAVVSLHASLSYPTYRESFAYDPGPVSVGIPGVTVTQGGAFTLDGRGGLGFGGALAWHFAGPVGLEARVDAGRVRVATSGARYDVRLQLPSPLPPVSTRVELGSDDEASAWLTPVSLNLCARTPGAFAITVSAGASYLPDPRLRIEQEVGLGVTGFAAGRIDVATLALEARSSPEDERSRFGVNGGLGVEVAVAPRLRLKLDARAFRFGRQRLRWERASGPPRSLVEERLITEVEERLPEPSYRATFFQATAGIALRL